MARNSMEKKMRRMSQWRWCRDHRGRSAGGRKAGAGRTDAPEDLLGKRDALRVPEVMAMITDRGGELVRPHPLRRPRGTSFG